LRWQKLTTSAIAVVSGKEGKTTPETTREKQMMGQVWKDWKIAALTLLLIMLTTAASQAQTLTVTLSASSVNFNLTAGSANNPGNTSITATTTCACILRTVSVYAYFNNSTSALADGFGSNIPSSAFEISANGGGFNALNNTEPFGGPNAGIRLSQFFVWFPGFGSPHSDTMDFNIDLSAQPLMPAGTYTGTLNIRAQSL
jgi:hypothetical protein